MPYRRLPNTDKARLRALRTALDKGELLDMYHLAYSQRLLNEIKYFLPQFEHALFEYQQGISQQIKTNNGYRIRLQKARLYVSHYIQALNMAVMRGEIKPNEQEYLGLKAGAKAVPSLNAEKSVYDWGEKVLNGEVKRLAHGGPSIYTPSLANVRVHFECFKEMYINQNFLKGNTARLHGRVISLRVTGDEIILNIWNEVEKKHEGINDLEKRLELCREYGLIYYCRKGEKLNNQD